MAAKVSGIGVSPGFAIGPVIRLEETGPTEQGGGLPQVSLETALATAAEQLETLASSLRTQGHDAEAGIIDAQVLMVRDPGLIGMMQEGVARGHSAGVAVQLAADHYAALLEGLDDPYMAARARDIQDVAARLTRALYGSAQPEIREPGIIAANDLSPSDTAALDRSKVLGLVIAGGGPTSHTAILARSLGIPAVVALGDEIGAVAGAERIALDGDDGVVIIDPDESDLDQLRARTEWRRARLSRGRVDRSPTATADGRRVHVAANIGSRADVERALDEGAEGVGLFRTEFLFQEGQTLPGEEEQLEAYMEVLGAMGGHRVVIRTLDVGGDKPLPYLPAATESNPFLGVRGIRYTLAHPEIFDTQLRALMRASGAGKLAVMFPMISDLSQIRAARAHLDNARRLVGGEAEVGVMVEIPAAALTAESLAREVDFFSVGTNDLVQYALAVDRINAGVSSLYQPFHPAVLRLIGATATAAEAHQLQVGVCGEMAGDTQAVPLLIGLGIDELSASPPILPHVREVVRGVRHARCVEVARRALTCDDADQVVELVRDAFGDVLDA